MRDGLQQKTSEPDGHSGRRPLAVGRRGCGPGLAAVLALLSGCPSQAGPTDEAIARYAGQADGGAATTPAATSGAPPSTGVGAAPAAVARRMAVTIERAVGVPDVDPGPGTSDPYVVLVYEGQRFKSSVAEGTEAPVWGDSTVFELRPGGVLEATLFDEDSLSGDEKLGVVTQPLPDLAVGQTQSLDIAFKAGKGGTVTLTLTGLARP